MYCLLAKGVDVNAANELGETPLHYAIWGKNKIIALIEAGANINAKNKSGKCT